MPFGFFKNSFRYDFVNECISCMILHIHLKEILDNSETLDTQRHDFQFFHMLSELIEIFYTTEVRCFGE